MNPAAKLKVFVSYARSDGSSFADEITVGLEVAGFDSYLDREDISAGEDWEKRLSSLIQASDTVVFVLTPRSVTSERCAWEVREAAALAKRIIPVVAVPVEAAAVPPELRRLNFIQFEAGRSFARGLAALTEALRTDLDWIREHTRLGELALRWRGRGGGDASLLRDEELLAAQTWRGRWTSLLPVLTEAHREFLDASAAAQEARGALESRRNQDVALANEERAKALARQELALKLLKRRTLVAGIGIGIMTLGLGGTAYWAYQQKERALEAHVRRESLRKDVSGQIVAYATSSGQNAMDTPNGSPYTLALLQELQSPDRSLWGALSAASAQVNQSSDGDQRPFISSDMNADLYLSRPSPTRRQRALLIGVGNFGNLSQATISGVYKDLQNWSRFLRERNFEVVELRDPTKDEILNAIHETRIADGGPANPGVMRVGWAEQNVDPEERVIAPLDTLLLVMYSGMGFSKGTDKYILASDVTFPDGKDDAAPGGVIDVAMLEKRMREVAAASVAVYDTQFGFASPR